MTHGNKTADIAHSLAARSSGVTVDELVTAAGISKDAAYQMLHRSERAGRLVRRPSTWRTPPPEPVRNMSEDEFIARKQYADERAANQRHWWDLFESAEAYGAEQA